MCFSRFRFYSSCWHFSLICLLGWFLRERKTWIANFLFIRLDFFFQLTFSLRIQWRIVSGSKFMENIRRLIKNQTKGLIRPNLIITPSFFIIHFGFQRGKNSQYIVNTFFNVIKVYFFIPIVYYIYFQKKKHFFFVNINTVTFLTVKINTELDS